MDIFHICLRLSNFISINFSRVIFHFIDTITAKTTSWNINSTKLTKNTLWTFWKSTLMFGKLQKMVDGTPFLLYNFKHPFSENRNWIPYCFNVNIFPALGNLFPELFLGERRSSFFVNFVHQQRPNAEIAWIQICWFQGPFIFLDEIWRVLL